MSWRMSSLWCMLVLLTCQQEKINESDAKGNDYLIEVKDLKTIVKNQNIKLLDFRKKEFYDKEHIAGALHIWRTDIEDHTYPYKGIMASKVQMESLFRKLGIKINDTLVVYDDNGLCEASRLWWILQNYNFKNIKLLNGGITDWKANNGGVTTLVPEVNKSSFTFANQADMQYYVSKEQVREALNRNITIVDTRTVDEFTGKQRKKDASKGGRIPKSIHIDWAEAINYDGDKKIKSLEDLESIYSKLNIKKNDSVILYCHSGVRSAHTTFVLSQLLGFKNVKNYDGSWLEWSYYDDLPYELDSLTLIKN